MSDRDKAGLRGPVKAVTEETVLSLPSGPQSLIETTKYTPDGRILEQGSKNTDGSEWVLSYAYRADGQLLKTVAVGTGQAGDPQTEYRYDSAGRLIEVKSGDKTQARYFYDEKGQKSVTATFDSSPFLESAAYAAHWEGSEMGFAPTPGGSLTTTYNEQGVATGARFYDAEGKVLGHIIRHFDSDGRITSEEQAADAPQTNLPEELRSHLNPEQLKSLGAMEAGMQNRTISYLYDAQGHVKEERMSGGIGERIKIMAYNERGDKTLERMTLTISPNTGPYRLTEAGAVIPDAKQNPVPPPITTETEYTYAYDSYSNWIEQSIVSRNHPDEAFSPGTVTRRKLTYY